MNGCKVFAEKDCVQIHLHNTFYEPAAIRNAAFQFSNSCYVFIKPYDMNESLVRFEPKKGVDIDLEICAKEFCNSVLDHQVRLDLDKMNHQIRNLIVKQAFSPVENLLVDESNEK